jgi:EmrB/QacA subfamily drug resistance transporter
LGDPAISPEQARGLRARLAHRRPGYPYSLGRTLAIFVGLMITIVVAAIDQTIVSTALPHITSDLGGVTSYSWVFSAFLLGQTVTVPIYGRLGDMYGRRRMLFVSIPLFLAGSALCGMAQSMTELIVFRGIQGLGAGGVIPLATATVAQIVPPRDRGRYQGLIGAAFAASSILGPTVGGLIVDHATWRWIFYVNIPIGLLALLIVTITIPSIVVHARHSIDVLGAALLAGGITCLLLGLDWGGTVHPWDSPEVVGALCGSAALLVVFGRVERRAKEPILPFALLGERIVAAGAVATALTSMCIFGTVAFLPLFVQGVIGSSATSSAAVLIPLSLSSIVTMVVSGQVVSRAGRYRPVMLAGPVVLGAGMVLLARMDVSTTSDAVTRNAIVAGIGSGLMIQVFTVAAQNAVPMAVLGVTTAMISFARSIGTTLGVTVFGLLVNRGLPRAMHAQTTFDHRLPDAARSALAAAMRSAFVFAAAMSVIMLFVVYFWIDERPLRRTIEDAGELVAQDPGL